MQPYGRPYSENSLPARQRMPSPISSNRQPTLANNPTTPNIGSAQLREKAALNLAQFGAVLISKEAKARHEASQKAAAATKAYQQELTEARQARARERLEEIKRRIEQLKSLVMMFGASNAKGMLRELKELAGELRQVAGTLKDGASGATPAQLNQAPDFAAAQAGSSDAPGEATIAQSDDAEGRAAYAATQALSETEQPSETANAQGNGTTPAQSSDASENEKAAGSEVKAADEKALEQQKDRQREEDAQSIQAAVRSLKELLAMLKSQLNQQQRNDKETRKQIDEITRLITDSEQAAEDMQTPGMESVGAVAAPSVDVGSSA